MRRKREKELRQQERDRKQAAFRQEIDDAVLNGNFFRQFVRDDYFGAPEIPWPIYMRALADLEERIAKLEGKSE